ncbi:AfsR/SARP family transcriptional regulator [Mycolicibacterium pulveris]|uniref:AfsR/SARP family transcriptional regulator n=1 Tax=Mycolicibacterium pulveris TaxID=36813 RepID=UPI003CF31CDA
MASDFCSVLGNSLLRALPLFVVFGMMILLSARLRPTGFPGRRPLKRANQADRLWVQAEKTRSELRVCVPGTGFTIENVDPYSLNLLGGFAVHIGDRKVDLPPACQRLVALLALKRRPMHRLWICAILWPNTQTRKAVASLRSATWRLRPVGADPLVAQDCQYVALADDVSVDWHHAVDLMERLLGGAVEPQSVAELLPLLRAGELLDTWSEQWVCAERSRYHAMRKSVVDALGHGTEKPVAHHLRNTIRSVHTGRPVARRHIDSGDPREP